MSKFKINTLSDKLYLVTNENTLLVLEQEGQETEKVDLNNARIIDGVSDVRALSQTSGYYSKLFYFYIIKTDGSVWKYEEEAETDNYTLEKINGIENCIMIRVGREHIIALTEDGSVFTWGNNEYGQLGNGTNESRDTPEKIQGLPKIIDIASGDSYCMVLSEDGNIYTWGSNFEGELGDGKYTTRGYDYDNFNDEYKDYEIIIIENNNRNSPYRVEQLSDIIQIAAGNGLNVALQKDGNVFEWGTRAIDWEFGNCLPTPQKVDISANIVQVTSYGIIAMALTDKGEIWQWGGILSGPSEGMEPPRKLKGFPKTEKIISGATATFLTRGGEIWQGHTKGDYWNDKAVRIFSKTDMLNFDIAR
jgi:hypothetical protein